MRKILETSFLMTCILLDNQSEVSECIWFFACCLSMNPNLILTYPNLKKVYCYSVRVYHSLKGIGGGGGGGGGGYSAELVGGCTDYTMFVRLSPAERHWGEGILITPCLFIYPTLGCDIQGFRAMGLSVQYWPRWFQDFRRSDWLYHSEQMGPIWGSVPCQKKIFFVCEISCFWVK